MNSIHNAAWKGKKAEKRQAVIDILSRDKEDAVKGNRIYTN